MLVILLVFCKHRWRLAFVKYKGRGVVLPRALQLANIIRWYQTKRPWSLKPQGSAVKGRSSKHRRNQELPEAKNFLPSLPLCPIQQAPLTKVVQSGCDRCELNWNTDVLPEGNSGVAKGHRLRRKWTVLKEGMRRAKPANPPGVWNSHSGTLAFVCHLKNRLPK